MNTEVTDVQTSLSITFFRDSAIPYRGELNTIEKRFFNATPAYLERCKQKDRSNETQWPERIAVQNCANEGKSLLARGKQQAQNQVTAQKTTPKQTGTNAAAQQPAVQVPSEPPVATIREMEITQNVFQSNQPGLQICLNFNIKNRKGIQCRAVTYFFDEQHNPLQDVNQRFKTTNGEVSVGSTFRPGFENCNYDNYILFLPYSELDRKDGEFRLGFNTKIYDEITKTFLTTSPDFFFRYTQNGKNMRGENITTPIVKATTAKQPKPSVKPQQKPASAPPGQARSNSQTPQLQGIFCHLLQKQRLGHAHRRPQGIPGGIGNLVQGLLQEISKVFPKSAFHKSQRTGLLELGLHVFH